MTNPMIPEQAVEAAMRAWGVTGEDRRNIVGCILEAAAPHMLAEAWEEGWDSFASFDSRPGGPYPTNPYILNNEGEK